MNRHRVAVEVDQAAAIKAGKNTWGTQVVEVDVAALSEDERDELARLPYTRTQREVPSDPMYGVLALTSTCEIALPAIAEATVETVQTLLRARRRECQATIERFRARPIAEIVGEGGQNIMIDTGNGNRMYLHVFCECYPHVWAALQGDIEAEIARQKQAKHEAEVQRWLDAPVKDWCDYLSFSYQEPCVRRYIPIDDRLAAKRADAQRLVDAEIKRRADNERRAAEDKAALEQQRRLYIELTITAHGTKNQQERLAAGALPLGEATALAEQVIFAALDGLPRYEKLTPADAEHSDECENPDNCQVRYDADAATVMPAYTWDVMQHLRELLGRDDATIEARRHVATTACEVETERWGIRIQIDEGG
ncbi:MAG TPA: hypothetical protein VM223_03845, partial [Planctomycetota bacterium]|nr:hypothetical protein [Planctomycetota bacterium]